MSPTNGTGTAGSLHARVRMGPYLTPYAKIYSTWTKELNLKDKAEENGERKWGNFMTLDLAMISYIPPPKAQATKGK